MTGPNFIPYAQAERRFNQAIRPPPTALTFDPNLTKKYIFGSEPLAPRDFYNDNLPPHRGSVYLIGRTDNHSPYLCKSNEDQYNKIVRDRIKAVFGICLNQNSEPITDTVGVEGVGATMTDNEAEIMRNQYDQDDFLKISSNGELRHRDSQKYGNAALTRFTSEVL